jgi:predicted DNA-binding transcriptional regulator AlpA
MSLTPVELAARELGLAVERFALALADAAAPEPAPPLAPPEPGAALLTDKDVAALTGIGHRTLQNWRSCTTPNHGPQFIKIGSRVRYRREDVEAWLAESGGRE